MSADDRQASEHLDDADRWLQQHSRLDASARRQLVGIAIELLKRVRKAQASPLIISGPPGCGKTTLSRLFDHLVKQEGETCQVLSLDDYYLTRSEREILANKIHPLLRHRGVPGTHDWHRLLADIDALSQPLSSARPLCSFDKSVDDRKPQNQWPLSTISPRYLVIEGWCLGAPPQDSDKLQQPVNRLEQEQDPDGLWRRYVNGRLADYCQDLKQRGGKTCFLASPGWKTIQRWRQQQEQELDSPMLDSSAAIAKFLATFERIVRHMQSSNSDWSDWTLMADEQHRFSSHW